MGFKLFLKEHFSFILFQLIVVFFLLSIFWLEGFRNLDTAIYAIAISLLLIGSFLTVRYMLRRRFLGKIIHLPTSMDDALTKSAKTSEHDVVEDYFHEFYRIYQHEVQGLYVKQSRQYKFMNQWIHQMKTPISVLELLMQEDSLDKKSVQEELDRLKRGLDMVLMNARLDNFESDMQIEQVNIRACMTAIINENKRLFITNRVFPTIEIDEELTVASDAKWLHFMLGQFITNAVKYTFEPNKKIYISAIMLIILFSSFRAYADSGGYIVKMKNMVAPKELTELLTEVNAKHHIYTADNIKELEPFAEYIDYIETNDEVMLIEGGT